MDIHPPPPEYRIPVYLHSGDTGAISGGGETAGGAGVDEMMGAGWNQPSSGRYRDRYRDGYIDRDGYRGGGGGGG